MLVDFGAGVEVGGMGAWVVCEEGREGRRWRESGFGTFRMERREVLWVSEVVAAVRIGALVLARVLMRECRCPG